MKGILALCGLFLSGALFAQRTLININTGWKFSKGQSAEAVSKWDNINLPHTWNINDVMDDIPGYYRGQGLYKRRMFIDAENKGQQLYLVFEGANQIAEIFINGKKAGRHIGGYAAFYVPITSLVRYGEQNELMVKVDNSHDQHIPPLSADFTFYGGIYRDAWLLKTNAIHFSSKENTKGIYISTPVVEEKKAVVHIKSIIDNDAVFSKRFKVVQTIRNKKGDIVGAASQKAVINPSETITDEQDIIILDPILWRPEFPYLYQLVTELRDEVTGSLLDKIQQPIGLRSFYFDADKGFVLNGKPYKLVGTSRHQDFKGMGNALPDKLAIQDIKLIKKMGGNFLRIAHYPQDPSILDACDSMGILTSVEIPVVNEITPSEQFYANCLSMQSEMIRQNYNHPSVIIWCYMNEVLLRPHYNNDKEKQQDYFKEINRLAKALDSITRKEDPARYTMMAHHGDYNKYKEVGLIDISMIVGWNLYAGWYGARITEFPNFLDSFHARHPEKILVVSEYGADADPRIRSSSPVRFDKSVEYTTKFHQYYISEMIKRPFVAAAMIWNLADFNSETRAETMPHINNKGLLEWDRTPKDPYYLYQAVLSKQPVLQVLGPKNITVIADSNNAFISTRIVQVATNLLQTELWLNGQSLGKQQAINGLCEWEVPYTNGRNVLLVKGLYNNKWINHRITTNCIIQPLYFTTTAAFQNINILLGGNRYFTDNEQQAWIPDQRYRSGSWGSIGGKVFKIPNNGRLPYGTDKNITGTDNDPIYQTQQLGIQQYKFDVLPGNYELTLHFAELLGGAVKELPYNLNDPERIEPKGKRIFNVYVNKKLFLDNFDITAQYGTAAAVVQKTNITVIDGTGIEIVFEAIEGEAVLNALQLKKIE